MPAEPNPSSLKPEDQEILLKAGEVLRIEARGLMQLAERLDERFAAMVRMISDCGGRLIVSGIGKSGIIGRKIVATLNSTGSHALFLHPVEALHGDLGMVDAGDIFLALSTSGETDEIISLLPIIRTIGCNIIAFSGDPDSRLARQCDLNIDVSVDAEACPLGLAPTASTTAMLAMGDALAVVLLEKTKFKSDDFRRIHPGGPLGKRLASRVGDLMLTGAAVPYTSPSDSMHAAVAAIDRGRLGAVLVVQEDHKLCGIITDGDVRRMVVSRRPIERLRVADVMTPQPRTVAPEAPTYDALNLMERHQITVLAVTAGNGEVAGIVHLHDILGKGAFRFNGGVR